MDYLQQTVDDLEGLLKSEVDSEPTVYDRAAAAMLLAQFYNGVENIMKRICSFHSVPLPEGDRSHAELFERFCDPPASSLPLFFPACVRKTS